MRKRLLAATLTALIGLPVLAAVPAQAAGTATVTVVHGVPGLTVDVYANGQKLLSNFKPGTVTDPQKLPAGSYDLAVFPAGQGPSGTPAIKADDVAVPAGANASVVAHLDAAGKPVLTAFVNDTSKIKAGQARLTVRHTAAAPAVDIRAGGQPVFKNLTNPDEVKADLPAGTVSADVVLAGTDTVALGPADLDLTEGSNTIVYAWGSAADKNLGLAVQKISGLHSSPSGVPTGLAAPAGSGLPLWVLLTSVLAAAGALLAGRRLAVRRPVAEQR